MHTILGANGAIANELTKELLTAGQPVRLVSRHPKMITGVKETVPADLTKALDASQAIAGSTVVYLCAGLPYNRKIWAEQWPLIMNNVIDACKRHQVPLIFFDNVYMYGKVKGEMTEETPYNPCSKKGEIRARIATQLMDETASGELKAMIARSADFYGPGSATGILNAIAFDNIAKDKKAIWFSDANRLHSFTYTPDAGKALAILSSHPDAFNQIWHLPTAQPPLTGKEYIKLVAEAFDKPPKHTVIGGFLMSLAGLFNGTLREMPEMLYQYKYDYLFNSDKFEKAFDFKPTPYAEGIKATAKSYRQ